MICASDFVFVENDKVGIYKIHSIISVVFSTIAIFTNLKRFLKSKEMK